MVAGMDALGFDSTEADGLNLAFRLAYKYQDIQLTGYLGLGIGRIYD